ncbi:hypothetical protein [Sulfurimonas sp.]|uniref:hypothetical protein n=1 Tax=Sulfurimonas sp. TaxID=2022749 RepID=UPI002B47B177|nr:hypothetical protein [Sulfurimonas sp.]
MKKYMILIFLLFVSLSLQANTPKINECINDIYFANSIMTSEKKADNYKDLIKRKILEEQYAGNVTKMKKELNFKTSYNQTHGYYGDIYDTYMFLSLEEDGWDTLTTVMKLVLMRGLSKATNLAGKIAKLSKKEKELFDKIVDDLGGTNYLDIYSVDRNIDLSKQINDYKKSIRLGHGIIIVAHGKGDIFTAKAYEDMLKPEGNRDNAWLEDYISWMSVGSPTREARGFHPYINFDNDKVADQGTLDATTNPNRSYMLNAVNEYIENSSDMQFHAFDYYMGQNISFEDGYGKRGISTDIGKKVIMDFLSSSIEKHKKASSQWATDQEIEKGTKNYRITVKHLHDPSVVMSEDVYPFAVAKKLYYVQGAVSEDISGYVKASCGGYKVEAIWDNQACDELYKLKGTNEIMSAECADGYYLDCATATCLIINTPTPLGEIILGSVNNNYQWLVNSVATYGGGTNQWDGTILWSVGWIQIIMPIDGIDIDEIYIEETALCPDNDGYACLNENSSLLWDKYIADRFYPYYKAWQKPKVTRRTFYASYGDFDVYYEHGYYWENIVGDRSYGLWNVYGYKRYFTRYAL